MKSVTVHSFAQIPDAKIPRSKFDRSHGYKTTFDAGYLVPVLVEEALPGDTFSLNMTTFSRLATPIVPFMDNMFLDSFFFAVPIRLIWDHWQAFNGEQTDPDSTTDYNIPQMVAPASTGYAVGSLSDYFGLPTGVPGYSHSSLFHRAYNLIWNEWFRDQNLQDSVVVDKDDGTDDPADYVLLRRGKRHDYFTSCLPWPQKGPAVELPLGSKAPVYGEPITASTNFNVFQGFNSTDSGVSNTYFQKTNSSANVITGTLATKAINSFALGTSDDYDDWAGSAPPYADLSAATAATINQLRQAFQVQRMYERDARGGTRYTEIIRSHFGVTSPDARLQRPEYLGGGSSPINIHPVAQTSPTSMVSPQGNLAAFGTSNATNHGFTKSFVEHCLIIGMVSARADLNYQQGLNRMFSRLTRFDFYWPTLSHLGEQAVLNKEIYMKGTNVDEDVFGYQERYAEYRYKPSVITGLFRSTAAGTLDIWHLAQKFTDTPSLDDQFIQDNPPVDRVIAVPSQPHFMFDAYFRMSAARPMPIYSVPGLIDHF